jgi:large subunit ribosomal protein L19
MSANSKSTDLVRRVTWDKAVEKKKGQPEFSSGDTIGVYVRVKEGEKERIQLFRGVVLKMQGTGVNRTFTVRKISAGVGVERTFPLASRIIDRIELVSRGKVRRSRLFYLRGLKGRSARLNSELYAGTAEAGENEALAAEAAAAASAAAGETASAGTTEAAGPPKISKSAAKKAKAKAEAKAAKK